MFSLSIQKYTSLPIFSLCSPPLTLHLEMMRHCRTAQCRGSHDLRDVEPFPGLECKQDALALFVAPQDGRFGL